VQKEVGVRTLATVPLAMPELVRPVGIIHRKQKPLTPAATRFVELLKAAGPATGEPAAPAPRDPGRRGKARHSIPLPSPGESEGRVRGGRVAHG
jgi:hypothetical protein